MKCGETIFRYSPFALSYYYLILLYLVFSVFSKPNFKNPTGSISASVGRIDNKWKSVTHQAGIYAGEDGYDKIYNSIGLVPNIGVGSKGKANSTTQFAISDGILTVDGKEIDTKTINTNTENTLHQIDKIFDKKKIEERQELTRLFAKNAYEQLHNWQPTTKDGKIAKAFPHGVIGEWAARMAGNAPGSGAVTEVNISPSVSLSASVGYIWYIGNLEDF